MFNEQYRVTSPFDGGTTFDTLELAKDFADLAEYECEVIKEQVVYCNKWAKNGGFDEKGQIQTNKPMCQAT